MHTLRLASAAELPTWTRVGEDICYRVREGPPDRGVRHPFELVRGDIVEVERGPSDGSGSAHAPPVLTGIHRPPLASTSGTA
jgi:hypothetical protein